MRYCSERYFSLFIFFLFSKSIFCQSDSLVIIQDELGLKDVHITKEQVAQNKVYTASRTLNDIEELPYSTYIISGEEILKKGYFTLVDVLKQVPGIFVSQPGSALHGETFMMNGLIGNTHAKIMIDNIPIKPYNSSGLPIGQQLPIRQAERIEITYGPSAVNNRTDAGAGTINIVTRKSDRPVYLHADLTTGIFQYKGINVLFGGKLGKNKNTLKFMVYGSSTIQDDINIPIINPFSNPNSYPANAFSTLQGNEFVSRGLLPQRSRQFSLNIDYRSFHLTVTQMYRNIHSAVGSSPRAISYNNQFTRYGESTNLVNFLYEKNLKKIGYKFKVKYVGIGIDNTSSFNYVEPLSKRFYDAVVDKKVNGNIDERNKLIEKGNELYFSNRRYAVGADSDFSIEPSITLFPLNNIEIQFGANLNFLSNIKYNQYYERPGISLANSAEANLAQISANIYTRAYLNFEKINFILGLNKFYNSSSFSSGDITNREKFIPQFAGLYKINPNLSLRVSYASSYLIPSTYWFDKSEQINKNSTNTNIEQNVSFTLNPQETKYSELGIAWKPNKKLKTDAAIFRSSNSNLLNFLVREDNETIYYGFDNSTNLSSKISGLRFSLSTENIINPIQLSIKTHFSYFQGQQDLPSGERLDHLLAQPKYIGQVNISFRLFKKMYISIDNVFIGRYYSRNIASESAYLEDVNSEYERQANWSMHIALSLELTDNFRVYLKGNNFNSNYLPGIDATGSPDDISLNLQTDPYIVTGVSYTIE